MAYMLYLFAYNIYPKENKQTMSELNLEKARKELVLKALNRTKTRKKASQLLGITERNLYFWIKRFKIIKTHKVYEKA
jgi:transcriptional regulator with PAS, ATPase and Fis domain